METLQQLKFDIESDVRIISYVMQEIKKLDAIIKTMEDPDGQFLVTEKLLKLGDDFEEFTERLEKNLKTYLEKQREAGEPINFSYQKLYNNVIDR